MNSEHYKYWKSIIGLKRCRKCKDSHGQIYEMNDVVEPEPPIHDHCRCIITVLEAVLAGKATRNGLNGADAWLKDFGKLPPYYITFGEAEDLGYKSRLGNLQSVAPRKMLTKGIYENWNGHLPVANGRIWYEADINYSSGYRGQERILFSNDGLIFVTYDHYHAFSEVVDRR